ncbi:MAG: hypothetical protein E7562_00465 [Ruminococcaceae bacterium]|nr:hypothetical protein [Oscillospiraceae bacterium]
MGSSDWFAVAMGIGTVFVGLICIIIICKLTSFFCNLGNDKKSEVVAEPAVKSNAVVSAPIENRQEILAAVTAVCAEEMGTDVSALRVISFKKL